ncbi:S-adenosyl-L-methionine-dependent methyltransferase [Podospora aff. communis PSN243]|uniref:S-adenosyl-L-methionine-dependent methyltransferase n=1 Tax=Podospora aff. communis PSN243 TaxID=3040156 RepID=A0AAV9GD73_9PEZI|nr:S-adenosyl-L-methionine-dependent methyltransferase [Podospora aff. communis PSN243]
MENIPPPNPTPNPNMNRPTPAPEPQRAAPSNDTTYKSMSDQYNTLESRIAWDWLCSGNRHFAYYDQPTRWPFPIGKAQRRMQEKLLEVLSLPGDAHVLDAGCGDGHVAIDLARRGNLRITAIDVVDRHVENARRNVDRQEPSGQIQVKKMGFENLHEIADGTFDGVYTSEALLHAADAAQVLREFNRVLKPGGRVVLHEYHNDFMDGKLIGFPREIARNPVGQNVPAFTRAKMYFDRVMGEAGFEEVVVRNYSANIEPMARLLNVSAVWRHIVMFLRLGRFFPNTAAREGGYVGQQHWAYVAVSGMKPAGRV